MGKFTPLDFEKYAALARQAAAEGCVLLKNDNEALPLHKGDKVAVFGRIAFHYYKSGLGSGGLVNTKYVVGVLDALKEEKDITLDENLLGTYEKWIEENPYDEGQGWGKVPWSQKEMELTDEIVESAKGADAAIVVVGRTAGEDQDNKNEAGSYLLTDTEREMVEKVSKAFARTIVVLNVGNIIDMKWVKECNPAAVLYVWQGGQEGGNGVADVLMGRVSPCGKLTDTIAENIEDYPSTSCFGDLVRNEYKEDIYVGYRYFDTFHVAPRYPFGYGMSYTNFAIRFEQMQMEGTKIHVYTEVENTGRIYDGKEVVQIYVSCPNGELKKEAQRLTAFHKTKLLKPREKAKLILSFDLRDMTSYRKKDAATVLEKGEYVIRLGNSSRNTRVCGILRLSSEIITEKHSHICKIPMHVTELEQKEEDILHAACDCRQNWGRGCEIIIENMEKIRSIPVEEDKITEIVHEYGPVKIYSSEETDAVMERLTLRDMAELSVGGGMTGSRFFEAPGAAGVTCTTLEQKGIPNVVMADGPAGLRLNKVSSVSFTGKVKGIEPNISCMKYLPEPVKKIMLGNPDSPNLLYQFTTAFPSGISLASSWNLELAEEVGNAVGKEMECYGVTYWLAPGLNIHRNPLCGRNFEYYSEDPLVSGKFAAAITKGVQKNRGCYVTLKHFCCNNQEDNRNKTNVNVNERALREIYLKGFEIAVKEAGPGAVMSSYNKVNGKYVNNSYRLLTQVLRNEWGFDGLVMTDWFATGRKYGNPAHAIASGNDLIMPGSAGVVDEIVKAVSKGVILEEDVKRSAANVLRGVLSSRIYQGFTRMHMKK